MILHRVRIEGYQALRNPIELSGLGVGLHVIHGPNETGKSTLIAAIARAFFDRYNTTDQDLRATQPWGTELAPRVTLEFETQGKRFRLEKRFLDEESSALSEWTGSRFERVADSVKSDDQVREMLSATAARAGAADLKNWGLARLLWMTQSGSRLEAPSLDDSLRQRLLKTLGSSVLSAPERELLDRLDQAYDVYYTAAKQSEKKGSPLAEARERAARAEQDLERCRSKWEEVDRLNASVVGARQGLESLAVTRAAAEASIREHRERARVEAELESGLKLKEQEFLRAQERLATLSRAQAEIRDLKAAIERQGQEAEQLEKRIVECETALRAREAAASEATAALTQVEAAASALSQRMGEAGARSELRALLTLRSDLKGLLDAVTVLELEIKSKREIYVSRKRPKKEEWEEANRLSQEILTLEGRLEDLGLELRFTAEAPGLQARWITPQGAGVVELVAGQPSVFRSDDSGELVIPGVGRVSVRAGAGASAAEGLRAKLKQAQEALAARLGLFGVATLAELQALWEATQELRLEGESAAKALRSALGPKHESVAAVAQALAQADRDWSDRLQRSGWVEAEILAAGAQDLGALSRELKQAREAHQLAQRQKLALDTETARLRSDADRSRRALDSARQALSMMSEQEAAKTAAAGGIERLDLEVREAVDQKRSLESEREVLAGRLPPPEQRAQAKIAGFERGLATAAAQEERARQELSASSALLQAAQGEGYYSKLAAAEEEHALAQELLRKRLAHAQSAKLLRSLAHAKRERMNSGLMEPIETSVVGIFDRIRGSAPGAQQSGLGFGTDLDELMTVRTPAGPASLATLSLGTREQAMLALRLAFGELLSTRGDRPEAQLVVLDDPLVNADPERQARAKEVLRDAAQKLQILVLTARPEDYRDLGAREYDLAALKAGTA
jgi:DNA repair exonuclease SbcCD ATPase subunit